jgi:hypothetical protein
MLRAEATKFDAVLNLVDATADKIVTDVLKLPGVRLPPVVVAGAILEPTFVAALLFSNGFDLLFFHRPDATRKSFVQELEQVDFLRQTSRALPWRQCHKPFFFSVADGGAQ